MDLRITGLEPDRFAPLFGLGEAELAARGAIRMTVDETPGFPDRITLREVPVGERVLLVNHVSLDAATPYRASHAIFVWEGASVRYDAVNEVPDVMRRRLLSLRGFTAAGMMRNADVAEGTALEAAARRMLADSEIAFLHVHNAKQGCYAGRIDRV